MQVGYTDVTSVSLVNLGTPVIDLWALYRYWLFGWPSLWCQSSFSVRALMAEIGTSWTGSSCPSAFTTAVAGLEFRSKEIFVEDLCRREFLSLELLRKWVLLSTPLNLSGRKSWGLVAEALSLATLSEKSQVADWILDTVSVRQAFANEGSCSLANAIELIVVAWGLEASCAGTKIRLE